MAAASHSVKSAYYTTAEWQGVTEDWLDPIWQPGSVRPAAGHVYEALSNGIRHGDNTRHTCIRNPTATSGSSGGAVTLFPGDLLVLNPNTELRLKEPGSIVEFRGGGLMLNGGAVGYGSGTSPTDNGMITLTGTVSVASVSILGGLGSVNAQRALRIEAALAGASPLLVLQGTTNVPCVDVRSANHGFSGGWIVKAGWLKGTAANSLGTGDIVVDGSAAVPFGLVDSLTSLSNGPAVLELDYDIVSPGTLTLGSQAVLRLHQACRFDQVIIAGTPLVEGTYSYAALRAAYPSHILAGGSGSLMVGPAAPPGTAPVSLLITGEGTVNKSPDQPYYNYGDSVTLTAIPGRWHEFAGWGDGENANPRVVTVSAGKRHTALFTPTTELERLGFAGVFRTAPVGMPAIFVDGQFVVNSDAVPRQGSAAVEFRTTFPGGMVLFTLDGQAPTFFSDAYTGPFEVAQSVVIRAMACDANFTRAWEADAVQVVMEPLYRLNVTTAGGGMLLVWPSNATYLANTEVSLLAGSESGWIFLHWLGDANGSSLGTSVIMNRDKCVEAVFGTPLYTTTSGGGAILLSSAAACYPYGTELRLTAAPPPGQAFARWGNAGSGTNNPLTYIVNSPQRTVSAAFAPLAPGHHALTVVADGFGDVTGDPPGSRFVGGTVVTLRAVPHPRQQFLGWGGEATGTQNPLSLRLDQSKVITAQFTKAPSLSFAPCTVRGGESFSVWLTGEWGAVLRAETAPSLSGPWVDMLTVTNSFGRSQFVIPAGMSDPQRFYRVVQ